MFNLTFATKDKLAGPNVSEVPQYMKASTHKPLKRARPGLQDIMNLINYNNKKETCPESGYL